MWSEHAAHLELGCMAIGCVAIVVLGFVYMAAAFKRDWEND